MPFQPVPDTVVAKLRYTWAFQRCENTLFFRLPTGWDLTTMDALAAGLFNIWEDHWRAQQSVSVELREILVTQLEGEVDLTTTYTPAAPIGGTNTSPSLPNSVSLCVSFRTGFTGRSARGRNYFIGLCEDQVTANSVNDATQTAILNGYNAVLDLANDFPCQWVVVQRYANNVQLPAGVTRAITDILIVDDVVDSQRRRLPGRGQ